MIKMTELVKIYENGSLKVKALHGVDLEIKEGEFVAIMGPSGSGKSTLMNIIGCLDQSSEGSYHLDGVNIHELNDNELADIRNQKIGFVFQSFNLLPKLTAFENVELPMVYANKSHKERRSSSDMALGKVGLSDRSHHKPNELSGGQKQRVAIARALVNKPSILLADEPTGNLDTRSGEEIMGIFKTLNEEGATIVMVTHELEIAEHAKRIIIVRDGYIVEDTSPAEYIKKVGGIR